MVLSLIQGTGIRIGAGEKTAVAYRYPVYNKTDGTFYENASSGIKEWKEDGSCTDYEEVTASSDSAVTWGTAGAETWVVVKGGTAESPITIPGVTVTGDVHLILTDGCNLSVTGEEECAGICVINTEEAPDANSLTIYGQSAGTGTLTAAGGFCGAGIGGASDGSGSNITINGGQITATSGGESAGIGGGCNGAGRDITINGGTVNATTSSDDQRSDGVGAGIGGGNGGDGSNITINGGQVTAIGGGKIGNRAYGGAGIGGGNGKGGSNITINGGAVVASSAFAGAGIGGGLGGDGSNITINRGIVIASSAFAGAGIGGGLGGSGSYITINGGTVTATGGEGGAGIGSGADGTDSSGIFVSEKYVLRAGDSADPTAVIENDGTTDLAGSLSGKRYVVAYLAYNYPVYNKTDGTFYENASSGIKEWKEGACADYTEVTATSDSAVTWGTAGEETWYVVTGGTAESPITIPGVIVSGDVHLILTDGCNLSVTGAEGAAGICVSGENNKLTIYGQSEGENAGQLTANGGTVIGTLTTAQAGAGIGGNNGLAGSYITINGGNVAANGGNAKNAKGTSDMLGAAGIGGGSSGAGSDITINAGTVTATGGYRATGIGGGYKGKGEKSTINGGTVTAVSGYMAAGIGGGSSGAGSDITINAGTVTAESKTSVTKIGGAGIGGGDQGSGSEITIKGGTVTATGGLYGAGIGGGNKGNGSEITIEGGRVKAEGGQNGAGIGGGYSGQKDSESSGTANGYGSYITIKGGEVTAKGGAGAAGIGGGNGGNGENITIEGGDVTAQGGENGAGIGGGMGAYEKDDKLTYAGYGKKITIKGGKVTATGGINGGAGIGGGGVYQNQTVLDYNYGGEGSDITISGGKVTATGDGCGAGIGGGGGAANNGGDGKKITIEGGAVTATGGEKGGAGIGGGASDINGGEGSAITISGGTVTATGGCEGADGIGCGKECTSQASVIFVFQKLILKAGDSADPTDVIENNGGDLATSLSGKQYVVVSSTAKVDFGGTIDEVYYGSLSEALEAAKANKNIVQLLADITDEKYAEVETGVTLDLNGFDILGLKGLYVTGQIIDSQAKEGNYGKVTFSNFYFGEEQTYTPIKNGDGYSFFNLDFIDSVKFEAGKFVFSLASTKSRTEAFKLLYGDRDTETGKDNYPAQFKIRAFVSWETEDGTAEYPFIYNAGFVSKVVGSLFDDDTENEYAFAFTPISVPTVSYFQPRITILDANGNTMYTYKNAPVFKTTDGGSSWEEAK